MMRVEALRQPNLALTKKFDCLNTNHILVGLINNECPPDQNFTSTQPNRYLVVLTPKKVGNAYKIAMSATLECITQGNL